MAPTAPSLRSRRIRFGVGRRHPQFGSRRSLLRVLFCAAALVTSCSRNSPAQSAGRGGQREAAPAPVTVATAIQTNVPVQVTGIGHVNAYSKVSVMSQVDGQLAAIRFQQGDELKEGQVIFEIDPATYVANLSEAKAVLARDTALADKAAVDVRRSTELFEQKIESADVHEQTLANAASLKAIVQGDEATVQNAKLQVSYCSIRSPINGRAGRLLVNTGNLIKKQDTTLLVINQLKPIYVDFSVPEFQLPEIRKYFTGGKLKVEAFVPGQEHHSFGELLLMDNTVDTNTGNIFLRAEFPNADEALWPGQFVNANLTLTDQVKVVIPSQAVQNSQIGQIVFIAKADMTVEQRSVVTGARLGDNVAVEKGVQAGEQVVVTGQLRLIPGARISIAKGQPNHSPPPPESSGY